MVRHVLACASACPCRPLQSCLRVLPNQHVYHFFRTVVRSHVPPYQSHMGFWIRPIKSQSTQARSPRAQKRREHTSVRLDWPRSASFLRMLLTVLRDVLICVLAAPFASSPPMVFSSWCPPSIATCVYSSGTILINPASSRTAAMPTPRCVLVHMTRSRLRHARCA
jgi:hypothetical protein